MLFNPFKKSYSEEDKKTFRFLQKNVFFKYLTEDELAEFLPYLYLRNFEKGEAIFFRGDPSQAFYIVYKGIVVLNIDIEDKFEELTHLRAGEAFGDNALLTNRYRIYTAICFSDTCELYAIPSTNIYEIFKENLAIKAKMMEAMAEYYDRYMTGLFRAYQTSFGFFDLGMAFARK
ncbi:MAG: cyclic nucleotide-binding domain-containing protein [Flammeovirgaceae bacterium]|nr:cyclic nucleotide-binding domain-containing protein [Flammeovirgaceae bacterium]